MQIVSSYKSGRLFCRYVIALFYFVFLLLFIMKIKHLLTSVCDYLRNVYYTKCVLFSICRSLRGTYKVKCELRWTIWSDYNREGRTNRKSRYVVTDSSYRVVRMKYLDQNCIPVVCMFAFFYFRMDILRTTSMMYHKKDVGLRLFKHSLLKTNDGHFKMTEWIGFVNISEIHCTNT